MFNDRLIIVGCFFFVKCKLIFFFDLIDFDFNIGGGFSVVMDFADVGVMVIIVVSYVNLFDLEGIVLLFLNLYGKRKYLYWFYV